MFALPARIIADALAPVMADWGAQREKQILEQGCPLDGGLLEFAAELGINSPEKLRLELRSQVPLPVGNRIVSWAQKLGLPVFHPAGMALGRGIVALSDEPSLLRHELVHLAQYQRFDGHLPFMRQYLFECLRYGYQEAPLEQEARELSEVS